MAGPIDGTDRGAIVSRRSQRRVAHLPTLKRKETTMHRMLLLLVSSLLLGYSTNSLADSNVLAPEKQTILPAHHPAAEQKPLVVIYTLSTCPHCHEAKEYLKNNNIPFVNREVDTDDEQMETLMKIYDSMGVPDEKRGVPLLVIGDRIRMQGFSSEKLQNALKEISSMK